MSDLITDRTTYIGGSDIVAIMGLDTQFEYANWISVYNKFTEKKESSFDEEAGHTLRGNTLEPVIERWVREHMDPTINGIEAFERFDVENDIDDVSWAPEIDGGNPWNTKYNCRTQCMIRDHTGMQEYLGGHVDGIGSQAIYEIKAPATHNIDYINRYGCKKNYIVQCQYYMMLCGITMGYVLVWDYDSWEPLVFKMQADLDLWQRMRSVTEYFWNCVQDRTLPSLEWQGKMGYQHLFSNEELNEVMAIIYEAREEKKKWAAIEKKAKPQLMTAVKAIWQEDQKQTQLMTSRFHVTGSSYFRGDTEVVKLSIKENEIIKKIEAANG